MARRLSPSYRVPLSRFWPKKFAHRSSRPSRQAGHSPHGMMNAPATVSPTAMP